MKKTDGSWKFRSDFCLFCSYKCLLEFIEKQAPQKALCLGPDPPLAARSKFIDFSWFFTFLGPSIQPEKASVKSASTPYPPPKVNFIGNLWVLIIRDPISSHGSTNHDSLYVGNCHFTLIFLVLQHDVGFYYLVVFLFDFFLFFLFLAVLLMWFKTEINQTIQTVAPKKGRLKAQTQEQAIVHYPISTTWLYLITTQFIRRRHRP
jgi:hypothetical protein